MGEEENKYYDFALLKNYSKERKFIILKPLKTVF